MVSNKPVQASSSLLSAAAAAGNRVTLDDGLACQWDC